ncbi:adenylate kinase [bacterium]|nr:adenylate kinase [bacterium]
MERVVVIGVTGAGKTTVARRLCEILDAPHVEIDALNWQDGWVDTVGTPEFEDRVREAVSGDRWVVDGNYERTRSLTWPRADTIVWLDLPFRTALARLLRRTSRRIRTGETLWGTTNRESFRGSFLSKDSIFLWQLKTYRRKRRAYPELLADPAFGHLTTHRLRSPVAVAEFLEEVGRG